MTMAEFWKSWLFIWILAGPILLGYASVGFSLYLSHRHMDAIKEALKNSRYIYIWGPYLGKRGVIWSLLEIAKIAGMIMMPRASLRIGELDPVDLENFPAYLKRLLKVEAVILVVGVVWMAIVYVLLKFK